jgi:hypothetical protein
MGFSNPLFLDLANGFNEKMNRDYRLILCGTGRSQSAAFEVLIAGVEEIGCPLVLDLNMLAIGEFGSEIHS